MRKRPKEARLDPFYGWRSMCCWASVDGRHYAYFWRRGRAIDGDPSTVHRAVECRSAGQAKRLATRHLNRH